MRWSIVGFLALATGACTIADVTTPPGEDRLVVEAVLRTDKPRQAIILHRSARGEDAPGEGGAEVVVTSEDGLAVVFQQADTACAYPGGAALGTCYLSPPSAGYWVVAGKSYELRVATSRGEVARGVTRVPGAFSLVGIPFRDREGARPAGSAEVRLSTVGDPPLCRIPPSTPLPVTWRQARGAWGYISPLYLYGLSHYEAVGGFEVSDPLELIGVSVSSSDTTIVLPTEFGVFDRFSLDQDLLRFLQGGLPQGIFMRLTVAAADRNYINGVRGGTFNPSGQVRVSSVAGDGVGVFGSLVPLTTTIGVGADGDMPLCGTG